MRGLLCDDDFMYLESGPKKAIVEWRGNSHVCEIIEYKKTGIVYVSSIVNRIDEDTRKRMIKEGIPVLRAEPYINLGGCVVTKSENRLLSLSDNFVDAMMGLFPLE